jgi:uncharacterized protein YjiS (DUF1127 family)
MAHLNATVNLRSQAVCQQHPNPLLNLVLRIEAWFDRRASQRALARLDERALADIGLTESDLGRPEPTIGRHRFITPTEWR